LNVSITRRGFFGIAVALGIAPKMALELPEPIQAAPIQAAPMVSVDPGYEPVSIQMLMLGNWIDYMEPYETPFTTVIRGDFVFDQYKYEWGVG
jgi:hypothetical protein